MTNYNENLGQTISNLHSFEFVVKNFLFFHNEIAKYKSPITSDLYLLKKHEETKLNNKNSSFVLPIIKGFTPVGLSTMPKLVVVTGIIQPTLSTHVV